MGKILQELGPLIEILEYHTEIDKKTGKNIRVIDKCALVALSTI